MLHTFSNPSSISYAGHSVCKQWRSKPVSIDTTWHNGPAPQWAASDEYKYISCSPLTVRNCPIGSLCTQLTPCRNSEDALDYYFAHLFFTFLWLF